jgi:carbon monoxide dehydrogenase subunit G
VKIPLSHVFPATPARVFATLVDPDALRRSIDGCEKMVKSGDDTYEVHLKVGIGHIRGAYVGKIRITAKQPPESLTLAIDGTGAPGFVKATAKIRLSPKGDQTELVGEGEGTVGGLVAAVGSRLIEVAAKKMTADFFARLGAQITSSPAS